MPEKKRTVVIEHLCRVEGHGGITVEIENGTARKVHFDIFEGSRFFESLVQGRRYDEVPQIVSRVCAICSAVHSLCAIESIENAFSVEVSETTKLLRDLLVQGGNIESHALHLFCLALPDFFDCSGALALAERNPDAVRMGLELKKLGNSIQECVGGRAVHPVNAVIGGFSTIPGREPLLKLRAGLEKGLQQAKATVDILAALPIAGYGETPTVYVALENKDETFSFHGDRIVTSTGEIWPVESYRKVCNERVVPHSRAKHSRLNGSPFMVGSLARLMINGDKLKGEAAAARLRLGLHERTDNIVLNNAAQGVELVYAIERSMEIIDTLLAGALHDEKPAAVHPVQGTGISAIEAPRGILYHSYVFDEEGRVTSADIITPTAQNCANVEKDMRSAVQALGGGAKEVLKLQLEKIARAYDPCISCSVHLLEVHNGRIL